VMLLIAILKRVVNYCVLHLVLLRIKVILEIFMNMEGGGNKKRSIGA
jgi:hypothetical protein